MTVSAIIPCYNAAATIKRAVQSLLQQSFPIDEIIIVNDGSTDGSLAVLRELEKSHTELVIIDQENGGVSRARNRAIALSKGKYLLTLDADDYFEPTFVEKAIIKFAENQNYGAVMCGFYRIFNGKKVSAYIPREITLAFCLADNGALACLLFKKDVILEAGGYDESMERGYEDWDLNIRVLKSGYSYGIVRELLFNYTDRIGSRTYTASHYNLELKMYIYEKYKEDYVKHGKSVYQELIIINERLKREKSDLMETTSFKLGNRILSTTNRVLKVFKIHFKK